MTSIALPLQLLHPQAKAPAYAHTDDAGLDLRTIEELILKPFERKLIPTGIAIAIPSGFAGFVQPRSGMAMKHGLSLINTPGLIDANYRGEILVPAVNLDPKEPIHIYPGDRIAQLVILPIAHADIKVVAELSVSERGTSGFGSSGKR